MDFWKNASQSFTKAVDYIVDRNRKAAIMNRLKIVIKTEKDAQNHAFIQLGKYYYQNMRDPQNEETEEYCKAVDNASARLKRAYAKIDELAVPTNEQDPAENACEDDDAGFHADEDFSFDVDEEIKPDAARQEIADDDEDYLRPFSVEENDFEDKPDEGDINDL
jgi:hypothetical protein